MEKRDYLLRQITVFMNALNRIINCIDLDDTKNAKIQIDEVTEIFGGSYFLGGNLHLARKLQ